MTAQTFTVLAYVVVAVLLWGYAGMLMLELRRRAGEQESTDRAD